MRNFVLASSILLSAPLMAEQAPDSVKQITPTIASWGSDPVLVEAVKNHNAKGLTLDSIKARDAAWREVDGLDDEMKTMMSSAAAQRMTEMENSEGYFFEIFLMGNQGANVAMTNKTSDYWQGDEAKWQESFKDGAGAVYIGEVEFDESAQSYLVQVSVPVKDGDTVVGAMTVGINIDELEGQ